MKNNRCEFLSIQQANDVASKIVEEIKEKKGLGKKGLAEMLGVSERSLDKIHKVKAPKTEVIKYPMLRQICNATGHEIEVFYRIKKREVEQTETEIA